MAMIEQKVVFDATAVSVAVSSPVWVQHLETWLGLAFIALGIILLSIRIALAARDYRRKK